MVLLFSGVTALLAIAVGFYLAKGVLAADQGTPKMIEIAKAIQEGALAYLKRQFRTIAFILVPLAVIVFLTSVKVVKPDGQVALSFVQSGLFRTLAFLAGCLMSGLTGFIGMTLATRGNVRTAAAARTGKLAPALQVAFRTGGVAGMFTVGLGLLGATIIITIFQNTSSAILVGFGFGGSLLALFLRVGGGIFTKAADVGADLVGKVEAGIPEDDPRNPATIADNVGDNVGDCAGMAADLFESYEVTLVASIILGVAAFRSIGANPALGLIYPLAVRAIGVLASIVGVFAVKAREDETNALKPINRGFATAGLLTVVGTAILAFGYVGNSHDNAGWKVFAAVVVGLVLAQFVSQLTEYFTGTEYAPVREIAEAARTGPATTVLSGHLVRARILRLRHHRHRHRPRRRHRPRWRATCSSRSTWWPCAAWACWPPPASSSPRTPSGRWPTTPPASPRCRASSTATPERIMVSLDAVGNTTKAVTKGFAIGSAVIAAVALFAAYIETIGSELGLKDAAGRILEGTPLFRDIHTQINVADPKIFIGLLIGGSVAFLFSALAIRAVGRTAGVVVQEVRRQFADGMIMAGTKRPDYGPVIDICTAASLRELATPALLAVLTPVIIGFGINYLALGAFLAAVILTGPAHGQLPVELRRGLGQRQEVHRGRPRGRQGIRGPQGRRHRRHRRRPVQGHRRPGAEPADQGHEPGVAADPAGHHQPAATTAPASPSPAWPWWS